MWVLLLFLLWFHSVLRYGGCFLAVCVCDCSVNALCMAWWIDFHCVNWSTTMKYTERTESSTQKVRQTISSLCWYDSLYLQAILCGAHGNIKKQTHKRIRKRAEVGKIRHQPANMNTGGITWNWIYSCVVRLALSGIEAMYAWYMRVPNQLRTQWFTAKVLYVCVHVLFLKSAIVCDMKTSASINRQWFFWYLWLYGLIFSPLFF